MPPSDNLLRYFNMFHLAPFTNLFRHYITLFAIITSLHYIPQGFSEKGIVNTIIMNQMDFGSGTWWSLFKSIKKSEFLV
jgi:hypothetical protein